MKLFFETAGQAQAFLAAVPLGLVLAACLDASVLAGPLRPLADVLMMLTAGFALMGMMLLSRDEALRLYHLLAILTGALLYMQIPVADMRVDFDRERIFFAYFHNKLDRTGDLINRNYHVVRQGNQTDQTYRCDRAICRPHGVLRRLPRLEKLCIH